MLKTWGERWVGAGRVKREREKDYLSNPGKLHHFLNKCPHFYLEYLLWGHLISYPSLLYLFSGGVGCFFYCIIFICMLHIKVPKHFWLIEFESKSACTHCAMPSLCQMPSWLYNALLGTSFPSLLFIFLSVSPMDWGTTESFHPIWYSCSTILIWISIFIT